MQTVLSIKLGTLLGVVKNKGKLKNIIVHAHATKAHRGCRGIGPCILNFNTGQMWSGKLQATTALNLVSNDYKDG